MQHESEQDRVGKFFLKARGKQRIWAICWYDPGTRLTTSITTGTTDRDEARAKLLEHAYKYQRVEGSATDEQLVAVLQAYWLNYGRALPSAAAFKAALKDVLQLWEQDDPNVSWLDRRRQLQLVEALRRRGLSDWTIQSRLNRIWAALNWRKRDNPALLVPEQITAADWKPVLEDRDQIYSLEELAALFKAASVKSGYSREHWWRFLVLALGTGSRVAALRELKWEQIDFSARSHPAESRGPAADQETTGNRTHLLNVAV